MKVLDRVIHFVPEAKFKEIDSKYSAQTICENGTCRTFLFQNEEWVCTGGWYHKGESAKHATRVVDEASYKGALEPLKYGQHWREVDKGNRERCYTGMLVFTGKEKRRLVFVGEEVTFQKLEVGKQLTIF